MLRWSWSENYDQTSSSLHGWTHKDQEMQSGLEEQKVTLVVAPSLYPRKLHGRRWIFLTIEHGAILFQKYSFEPIQLIASQNCWCLIQTAPNFGLKMAHIVHDSIVAEWDAQASEHEIVSICKELKILVERNRFSILPWSNLGLCKADLFRLDSSSMSPMAILKSEYELCWIFKSPPEALKTWY